MNKNQRPIVAIVCASFLLAWMALIIVALFVTAYGEKVEPLGWLLGWANFSFFFLANAVALSLLWRRRESTYRYLEVYFFAAFCFKLAFPWFFNGASDRWPVILAVLVFDLPYLIAAISLRRFRRRELMKPHASG
ncbi:MAG: hypothetical protein P9L99_10075 [Candidatus Lernaella stagnicola]|nr:hypothetical protein [Candidatus Lernaella stagnicola]